MEVLLKVLYHLVTRVAIDAEESVIVANAIQALKG